MKRLLLWTVLCLVMPGAVQAQSDSVTDTTDRMFLSSRHAYGATGNLTWRLRTTRSIPICARETLSDYGGVNAPCSLFARYMFSGLVEVRPFGKGQFRRFMVFGQPAVLIWQDRPAGALHLVVLTPSDIEQSWGLGVYIRQGIRIPRDPALPVRPVGRSRSQSGRRRTWATMAPGEDTTRSE